MVLIHQRHRQTDGQTTWDRKIALCIIMHHTVKTIEEKINRKQKPNMLRRNGK